VIKVSSDLINFKPHFIFFPIRRSSFMTHLTIMEMLKQRCSDNHQFFFHNALLWTLQGLQKLLLWLINVRNDDFLGCWQHPPPAWWASLLLPSYTLMESRIWCWRELLMLSLLLFLGCTVCASLCVCVCVCVRGRLDEAHVPGNTGESRDDWEPETTRFWTAKAFYHNIRHHSHRRDWPIEMLTIYSHYGVLGSRLSSPTESCVFDSGSLVLVLSLNLKQQHIWARGWKVTKKEGSWGVSDDWILSSIYGPNWCQRLFFSGFDVTHVWFVVIIGASQSWTLDSLKMIKCSLKCS